MSRKKGAFWTDQKFRAYRWWFLNVVFMLCLVSSFGYFQFLQFRKQLDEYIDESLIERGKSLEAYMESFINGLRVLRHTLEVKLSILEENDLSSPEALGFEEIPGVGIFTLPEGEDFAGNIFLVKESPSSTTIHAKILKNNIPVFGGIKTTNPDILQVSYISADFFIGTIYPYRSFDQDILQNSAAGDFARFLSQTWTKFMTEEAQESIREHGYAWTPAYRDVLTGIEVITCVMPVQVAGEMAGIILFDVEEAAFSEMLAPFQSQKGVFELVTDRSHDVSSSADSFSSASHVHHANHGGERSYYYPIPQTPWHLCYLVGEIDFRQRLFSLVSVSMWMLGIILFLVIIGYFYLSRLLIAKDLATERALLETQLKRTELRMLRAQINPHFLFNSLNSVRALVTENTEKARWAVTQLSSFLRKTLTMNERFTISIAEEIECVQAYISLEKIRFDERIDFSLHCPADLQRLLIPPMMIQGMIENAVKHGVSQRKSPTKIELSIFREENFLYLRVINDGMIISVENSTHIGTKNTMKRLSLMYGKNASFDLREQDGRVIASVKIPLLTN